MLPEKQLLLHETGLNYSSRRPAGVVYILFTEGTGGQAAAGLYLTGIDSSAGEAVS